MPFARVVILAFFITIIWAVIVEYWIFFTILAFLSFAVWSIWRDIVQRSKDASVSRKRARRPSFSSQSIPKVRSRDKARTSSTANRSLESTISELPKSLTCRSGSVFYTGPSAFEGVRPLYILGLNPGGSPEAQSKETIDRHLASWRTITSPWSAYLDDSWQGKPPGTHGIQPRMRHMFERLGLDLRNVPASNLVFARSIDEAALATEEKILLAQCWPLHQTVIETLDVRVVLCLGGTTGRWVREALGAYEPVDRFVERNARGWVSEAHVAPDGRAVVTVTHPGRANWCNSDADPTPLVRSILKRGT